MSKRQDPIVLMRIVIVTPPTGVHFAVQRGRAELLEPSSVQHEAIQFDFALRLGSPRADGSVNFLGEYAQGPQADRFVYINSGTLAGQLGSNWTRRAKLKLAAIPASLLDEALTDASHILEARVIGTLKDGSPVCASVKAEAVIWRLLKQGV